MDIYDIEAAVFSLTDGLNRLAHSLQKIRDAGEQLNKNKIAAGGSEIIFLTSGYEDCPIWRNTENTHDSGEEAPVYEADFKRELEKLEKLKKENNDLRERINNQPVTQLNKVYNIHRGNEGKLPKKMRNGWK